MQSATSSSALNTFPAADRQSLEALIAYIRDAAEALLESHRDDEQRFWSIVDHHFAWMHLDSIGGKHVRPLITLLAGRANGAAIDAIAPAALALEVIHEFTLILDDFMDEDEYRRGLPAAWCVFGPSRAITAATGLYTIGFSTILNLIRDTADRDGALRAAEAIMRGAMRTHHAQLRDLEFEETFAVSVDEAVWTAAGRSSLIASGAEVGAILAGAGDVSVTAFRDFGDAFATAYSLADDYRNIWGSQHEIGKPFASDIRQRKKSVPVMLAYHDLPAGRRQELESIYAANHRLGARDVHRVKELINTTAAAEMTRSLVEEHRLRALDALHRSRQSNATVDLIGRCCQALISID